MHIDSQVTALTQAIKRIDTEEVRKQLQGMKQAQKNRSQADQSSTTLKERVDAVFGEDKIGRYRALQEKKRQNQFMREMIITGKGTMGAFDSLLTAFSDKLQQSYRLYRGAVDSLSQFEALSVKAPSSVEFPIVREQFYAQLLGRISSAKNGRSLNELSQVLEECGLPLSKEQVRKEGPDQPYKSYLLKFFYFEHCLQSLEAFLQGLLQKQSQGSRENSAVLEVYWSRPSKDVVSLFVDHPDLRNIEQPGWMMDYMQMQLNTNYRFFSEHLCSRSIPEEIRVPLLNYFLKGSLNQFILPALHTRFEADLPFLNNYLVFNLLDQVGQFEQKLTVSFNQTPNLLEPMLLQKHSHPQLLSQALQYEEQWIQNKVMDDFAEIDYNKVNLKNLDAFNIVVNFLSLFDRLYRKYAKITYPTFANKITEFYQGQIIHLIRHIKTSFDRIYQYSSLPKIEILLGFQRIERELRRGLREFLSSRPEVQEQVQQEYYSFLQQCFEQCAYEELNKVHKKVHISLSQMLPLFASPTEHDHQTYLNVFAKISQEWGSKVEQIGKFQPFTDGKIRGIFFSYLQASTFSDVGLNLYIRLFEPFLRAQLTQDQYRGLMTVITAVPAQDYRQYLQSHAEWLAFLSGSERKELGSFKIKYKPGQ